MARAPNRYRPLITLTVIAFSLLLALEAAPAATVYVDLTNESGTEDGSEAFPYNTIQEGIDNASAGDDVVVAPGQYREVILMADGVNVRGSGPQVTSINAAGIPNSAVTFNSTRSNPLLTGFTIFGGQGDQRDEIGGVPVTRGGGILILESSPTIQDNVITGNVLDEGYCLGAGIYVFAQAATPRIQNNVITGNAAVSTTVPNDGLGGGIYIEAKSGGVIVAGNRIESNLAVGGGGVFATAESGSAVQLQRNTLRGNGATTGAAVALTISDSSTATVVNNLFRENGSTAVGAVGGAIAATAVGTGVFSIVNNSFDGQSLPSGSGGALYLDDSAATTSNSLVANSIFTDNGAVTGGGIDHTSFSGTIRRNDFFGNVGGDLYDAGGSTATIIDNLFVDPVYQFPAGGDFRLHSSSPLIDTAEESLAPGVDLYQFARPYDGDGDATAVSDFGAFEFPSGEVMDLLFDSGGSIDWQVLPAQDGYNLYRGSLARLLATGEYTQDPLSEPLAERFCDLLPAEVPYDDAFVPPLDQAVFYLVSFTTGAYEGTLGESSAQLPRLNGNPCP